VSDTLLLVIVVLLVGVMALQVFAVRRRTVLDLSPLEYRLQGTEKAYERAEDVVREEFGRNRVEAADTSRSLRDELGGRLKEFGDTVARQLGSLIQTMDSRVVSAQEQTSTALEQVRRDALGASSTLRGDVDQRLTAFGTSMVSTISALGTAQEAQLDRFAGRLDRLTQATDEGLEKVREKIDQRLQLIQEGSTKELEQLRQDNSSSTRVLRDEIDRTLGGFGTSLVNRIGDMETLQRSQLQTVAGRIESLNQETGLKLDAHRAVVDERLQEIRADGSKKLHEMREEATASTRQMREDVQAALKDFDASMRRGMESLEAVLGKLTESSERGLDRLREAVELRLRTIQQDNTNSLERIRATVDDKLHDTLQRRLGDSFRQVSERLEQVHKGLGEMQALATGVGDLKRVLTNVKARGTWGEVQLGAMLEQVLTADQYAANVATKGGREVVEFAIKLPGRSGDPSDSVWLPIDAKFPMEDYQRLVAAQEQGDAEVSEAASKQLEKRIRLCAATVRDKYLSPPRTTSFGVLFLPTEGLFAEVVRRPGLMEGVQREYDVVIAGPSTLWAILNSLRMGFQTLSIEKRSAEVQKLLSAVKTEFSKLGGVLGKVQQKLNEASSSIDVATRQSRMIEQRLSHVEVLPAAEAGAMLAPGPQIG
jgi:DNA recombination protein RmuC